VFKSVNFKNKMHNMVLKMCDGGVYKKDISINLKFTVTFQVVYKGKGKINPITGLDRP
jgi:hypothetical protein